MISGCGDEGDWGIMLTTGCHNNHTDHIILTSRLAKWGIVCWWTEGLGANVVLQSKKCRLTCLEPHSKWEQSLHCCDYSHRPNMWLYNCTKYLKSLFHMDNRLKWLTLSYMWRVFQDEIWRCGTFDEKAINFFLVFVVDFDISSNICQIQNQNRLTVFRINQMCW